MSSEPCNWQVGQRVRIIGKGVCGNIAFIGETSFAPGQWVGVVLDDNKGKNNGTVRGVCYFKCSKNYGIFVRATQLLPATGNHLHEQQHNITSTLIKTKMNENTVKIEDKQETSALVVEDVPSVITTDLTRMSTTISTTMSTISTDNGTPIRTRTTKIVLPRAARPIMNSSSQLALNVTLSAGLLDDDNGANGVIASAMPMQRSKTSVSPTDCSSYAVSRQQSLFVETGFLEILQPRFTPGKTANNVGTITTTTTIPSSTTMPSSTNANKAVKQNILKEQLETELQVEREKNQQLCLENEKLKLQNQQLNEFKTQILEQQILMQRDMQRLHQELRDAHDEKRMLQHQMSDLQDNMELATLDKEVAEERVETIQLELEIAQERIEELSLDLDIMRLTNNTTTTTTTSTFNNETSSMAELIKLQHKNQRLTETVVRLRDALTQEKLTMQKINKDLDTRQSEINELQQTKQTLSRRVDLMEQHIIDLKEQVDAALGSEEMVASLTAIKFELEDRIKLLEEEVSELEALEQIHEQLLESNHEMEQDIREELSLLQNKVSTMQQEQNDTLTRLYDRDSIIGKFRELVRVLQVQLEHSQSTNSVCDSGEAATSSFQIEAAQHFRSLQDFNQLFFVSKAYERAVDIQLNTIALKLSQLHVQWLLAFVPDDFLLRGGAHDVILALLTLERLNEKLDVICQAIHEKFPSSCDFGKAAIYEGFSVQRCLFRCKCLYFLRSLKLVLQQLIAAINGSEYELCANAAIYRQEIEAHEQHIDEFLRLLKSELLDENTSTVGVEATLVFFNNLLLNLLAASLPDTTEGCLYVLDALSLYNTLLEVYEVGFDGLYTAAGLLQTLIQVGEEQSSAFGAMSHVLQRIEVLRQQLRKLQHKLPKPHCENALNSAFSSLHCSTSTFCSGDLKRADLQQLQRSSEQLGKALNLLVLSAREATRSIFSSKSINMEDELQVEDEISMPHAQLWQLLCIQQQQFYVGEQAQHTPKQLLQHCLKLVERQLQLLAEFVIRDEEARQLNKNTLLMRAASSSALYQRAVQTKQYYEDVKLLRQSVDERDKEIKTLKYVAKMKQNDYSEMQIRKDMAERNLGKLLKEQQQFVENLQTGVSNLLHKQQEQSAGMEGALNALELRLVNLEHGWQQWQSELLNSKHLQHRCADETSRELQSLQWCLRHERERHAATQAQQMKQMLRNLTPIHVPAREKSEEIKKLEKQLISLKRDWLLSQMSLAAGEQLAAQRQHICQQSDKLIKQILHIYFKRNSHRRAKTDFAQFPTLDFAKQFFKTLN